MAGNGWSGIEQAVGTGCEPLDRKRSARYYVYMSASFLAYGVAAILGGIVSYAFPAVGESYYLGVLVMSLPSIAGGFVAGYVAERLVSDHPLRLGVLLGLGAFIVSVVMSMMLSGRFEGAIWVAISYFMGVSFGGWAKVHSSPSRGKRLMS